MLNTKQIEKNISWLLANGSPPVRYLTHKHLLKADTAKLADLWSDVLTCSEALEIFGKQEEDGSWCAGGSWASEPKGIPKAGYSAFTPKYNTTVWVLSVLGDMGFTIADSRIQKAVACTIKSQLPNGLFSRFRTNSSTKNNAGLIEPDNSPCELAIFLLALGKVRAGDVISLDRSNKLLRDFQREDGGWVRESHRIQRKWDRSCPWVSAHAVSALYYLGDSRYEESLKRGLKFLVWHLSLKNDFEIQRFFYHGHRQVQELLMLSEFKIGLDEKPVQVMLDWLMSMFEPENGRFHYSGKSPSSFTMKNDFMNAGVAKYRLHHLIEDDWLTYWGTRIALNLLDT